MMYPYCKYADETEVVFSHSQNILFEKMKNSNSKNLFEFFVGALA